MEKDEIAVLKDEIVRLNKLIGILIEQNDALKADIAVVKVGNTTGNVGSAFRNFNEGTGNLISALAKIYEGYPEVSSALTNIYNANPEIRSAIAKVTKGTTEIPGAVTKISNGNPEVISPKPAFLSLNANNLAALSRILKANGYNKVRYTGIRNTATILLHFYNKGNGSHAELRKLTGLSRFGMAKFTRSLKKRGLIHRDGWQKFILTPHAHDLIEKAGCKG